MDTHKGVGIPKMRGERGAPQCGAAGARMQGEEEAAEFNIRTPDIGVSGAET